MAISASRADSERTVQKILRATERALRSDPAASIEQIAAAAGVARTTVHRRFTSREALIEALTDSVVQRFLDALDLARPEESTPEEALRRTAEQLLDVKIGWSFALAALIARHPLVDHGQGPVYVRCSQLMLRARQAGLIQSSADIDWCTRVFLALLREAANERDGDRTALANRVLDIFLNGTGEPRGHVEHVAPPTGGSPVSDGRNP